MKNTYVLLIVQALLTLLLFFSEGYVRYTTMALFLLIDLILFFSLLTHKWSYEELLTLAAIFCSGIFMLFYVFMKSAVPTVFGVALMLLFLVIAMLDIMSPATNSGDARTVRKSERLSLPQEPAHYYDVEYDMDYEPQPAQSQSAQVRTGYSQVQAPQVSIPTKPEPVMHVTKAKKPSDVKDKLAG